MSYDDLKKLADECAQHNVDDLKANAYANEGRGASPSQSQVDRVLLISAVRKLIEELAAAQRELELLRIERAMERGGEHGRAMP